MPEMHLYEFAVIRVVPRVEREEFMNVGIIMYCPAQSFLQTLYELKTERLSVFAGTLDMLELEERLRAFRRICAGRREGGTIGQMPIASRFRWLTAARSTVIQTSPVHPGLCTNAQETLVRLHAQLVQ